MNECVAQNSGSGMSSSAQAGQSKNKQSENPSAVYVSDETLWHVFQLRVGLTR